MTYVPRDVASKELGICATTLRKYAGQGKIKFIRNEAGQRLYDIDSYSRERGEKQTLLYCRVSSSKQKPDLDRQAEYLQERYPGAEVIKDIGSGLNYKRKGLKAILERCLLRHKLQVVVAHRDRLCRFGHRDNLIIKSE